VRRPVTDTISTERLAVYTAAVDISSAKELASHRQTGELTLRPHASGERRFELQSRLTVRPGRYEIRVGAEVSGSAGGVFTPVEVPDFSKARLSLSGLVLGLRHLLDRPRKSRKSRKRLTVSCISWRSELRY